MYEYTTNGMKFTSFPMGSLGAGFILFPDAEHTRQQVTAATNELCRTRDVASLRLASEDDRDLIYRREIFREPGTHGLRWYQFNTTPELIRSERIKGTSPKDFVNTYILPFTKETEEEYLEQFGKQIYEI